MGLRERVERRLAELGMTPTRAAKLMGGVAQSFVRDITEGRKRSVRGDNLSKLARVLQKSEAWLLRGIDDDEAADVAESLKVIEIDMIGRVAAGVWVPETNSPAAERRDDAEKWPIAPVLGYDAHDLFALTVDGDAANLGYERGAVLIAASPAATEISERSHVILATHQGPLVETVVRALVRLPQGRHVLADPIADPFFKDAWSFTDGKTPGHDILGVVIAVQFVRQQPARLHRR